jgi:putative transposase
MTRKRFSEDDILNVFRQIELDLSGGSSVEMAVRNAGISNATYYKWCKFYGGMGKSKLHKFKSLEKENERLKRIVAELELDKLILKESLDYLKPRA